MRSVIIVVLTAAAGFLYNYLQQADRDVAGSIISEGNIDAFAMQVGDCFNDDPEQDATDECVARFESFVGRDYMSSQLDVLPMYPTRESWDELDDREIVCAV